MVDLNLKKNISNCKKTKLKYQIMGSPFKYREAKHDLLFSNY